MPATALCGVRLRQLATDNTLFYFMIALVQVVWLFIYWIGIVAFTRPETCDPGTQSGGQQWGAVFACLALFIAQAAITVAAVLLTMRGGCWRVCAQRVPRAAPALVQHITAWPGWPCQCRPASALGITPACRPPLPPGTPLEPASKRRWVGHLSLAYLASLPANIGLVAWADWVVRAGDGSCWSSGNRSMPSSVFFGAWGVLLGQM